MAYSRGEVWWGPAPHKTGPAYRPWLIVSDDSHPFSSVECIAVGMTTQRHQAGLSVPNAAWVRGGSDRDSFISPWYTVTLKHRDLDAQQGELSTALVSEAVTALHDYTPEAVTALHDYTPAPR